MPKVKTRSAAKKRFKKLKSGGIKRARAFRRHLMTCKSRKTKRKLRGGAMVHPTHMQAISRLLPNG